MLSGIGVGFGVLLYFVARHAVREVFDVTEIYSQLPVVGLELQVFSLVVVLFVVVFAFNGLGKAFDIHKM